MGCENKVKHSVFYIKQLWANFRRPAGTQARAPSTAVAAHTTAARSRTAEPGRSTRHPQHSNDRNAFVTNGIGRFSGPNRISVTATGDHQSPPPATSSSSSNTWAWPATAMRRCWATVALPTALYFSQTFLLWILADRSTMWTTTRLRIGPASPLPSSNATPALSNGCVTAVSCNLPESHSEWVGRYQCFFWAAGLVLLSLNTTGEHLRCIRNIRIIREKYVWEVLLLYYVLKYTEQC